MRRREYDVVVIGAGMVGATAACGLADAGLSVLLLDRQLPPAFDPSRYALRVSAINRATERLLDRLGVWKRIAALRASPFRRIVVWDAGSPGEVRFDAAESGEPVLGHIVENDLIVHALAQGLDERRSVTRLAPVSVERLEPLPAGMRVGLSNGTAVQGRLLVGADGRESQIRELLRIGGRGESYGERAIVAEVATERPHAQTAWQRFLPTGPLAFLPLANGHCSIVWSGPEAQAERLLALDDNAFSAELSHAFEHRLGAVRLAGERAGFALLRAHAQSYLAERAVLIGDAAHAMHPMAGQGVNLGMADADALVQVLGAAHRAGRDIGHRATLRPFERWRRAENELMLGAVHGLHTAFAWKAPWLAGARGAGMRIVDRLPPLKRLFMARAMGNSTFSPAII
jgi:2-octaprenylphenol hydroxylase